MSTTFSTQRLDRNWRSVFALEPSIDKAPDLHQGLHILVQRALLLDTLRQLEAWDGSRKFRGRSFGCSLTLVQTPLATFFGIVPSWRLHRNAAVMGQSALLEPANGTAASTVGTGPCRRLHLYRDYRFPKQSPLIETSVGLEDLV